jgi:PucR family transcriptional regulator, purine catabolism regulatory protein
MDTASRSKWTPAQALPRSFGRRYSRPVPLPLSDVLANPRLSLRLIDGDAAALSRPVRWVAVTELADPRPFLSGGELVLTTGLRQRTAATQREFVDRLAERDVVGLGFGTGLTHNSVPAATLAHARLHGLPVLEIPYSTPFIAIDRFVADRILEEQYGRFHDLLVEHDTLARSLLSGRGLGALVESLHQILDTPVMVVDRQGRVLAATPASAAWPVEQILYSAARDPAATAGEAAQGESGHPTAIPVRVENTVLAYLCCRRPRRSGDVLPYAVSLVGLELARRQAVLAGQRQLAGQVLEDVVRGTITTADAERRLASSGIRPAEEHAILVGTLDHASGDLRRDLVASPPLPEATTAVLENLLVAVIGPGQPLLEAAHLLHAHLEQQGGVARVGIGGWYSGINGLRWSYYEAHEAMTRGPGINEREPMSISGLLLASEDVPLRDLAEDMLRPLREFDTAHTGALIPTLRAYLEADGSVAAVAERLIVHRNTVRYRLAQIEQLTGRTLTSTATRVQLWLALSAARLGPGDDPADQRTGSPPANEQATGGRRSGGAAA